MAQYERGLDWEKGKTNLTEPCGGFEFRDLVFCGIDLHQKFAMQIGDMQISKEGLDTPEGRLYRPLHLGWQIVLVFACFVGSIAIGGVLDRLFGSGATLVKLFWHLPFLAIFFLGYSAWTARAGAIFFENFGRGVIKMLLRLVIHRKKPESLSEFVPTPEKVLILFVRVQKAGVCFAWAGWIIAAPFAIGALFVGEGGGLFRPLAALMTAVIWGHVLANLARRGRLPLPDGEGED